MVYTHIIYVLHCAVLDNLVPNYLLARRRRRRRWFWFFTSRLFMDSPELISHSSISIDNDNYWSSGGRQSIVRQMRLPGRVFPYRLQGEMYVRGERHLWSLLIFHLYAFNGPARFSCAICNIADQQVSEEKVSSNITTTVFSKTKTNRLRTSSTDNASVLLLNAIIIQGPDLNSL